jgi:hypothetical protein
MHPLLAKQHSMHFNKPALHSRHFPPRDDTIDATHLIGPQPASRPK